jgi:RNA polymerase sigma-70 factor (ECF subfamily)
MVRSDFNAAPLRARPSIEGVHSDETRVKPIAMDETRTDAPADATHERAQLASDWERVRTAVFAQLVAGIGSFHDAEDVLQEVAVSVAKKYGAYDPRRPFIAWALGIARNHMLMYFRKHHRDRLVFKNHLTELVGSHLEALSEERQDLRREALYQCLNRLDADRRRLIEMRYSSGLSVAEMAERLGKSVAAVKGSLHRVRRALEKCVTYRTSKGY